MSQETRNKVYAAVGAALTALFVFGVINQEQVDSVQAFLDAAFALLPEVLGLVAAVTAFIKSLPSRTTTLDIPKAVTDNVVTLTKANGTELAGPANPLPDGTVTKAG